jgi:5-methylcytosine-specific restriction endonuclease McrA
LQQESEQPRARFERVLLLNTTFEPLRIVSWQRAMILLSTEKAEVIEDSEFLIRGVSRAYSMPSIIRLLKRARPRRDAPVRFSRRNVYLRDKYRCQYCNILVDPKEITCDHVIPRSRGGKTTWDNVVACCHPCNLKKSNHLPEEAGMRLAKVPTRLIVLPVMAALRQPANMPNSWLTYLNFNTLG